MPYASLIKSLPQLLSQPTSIAVMASAGIHAVAGVALPYLQPASQGNQGTPQTVQLVELSPTELSRVPELAPPPLPPSALYPTPLTSAFPPLDRLSPPVDKPSNSALSKLNLDLPGQQLAQKPKRNGLSIQDAPVRQGQQPQANAKRLFQPENPNLRIAPSHSTVRLTPPRSRDRFVPRATRIPVGLEPSTIFPPLTSDTPTGQPSGNNIIARNQPAANNPAINQPPANNPGTNQPATNNPGTNQPAATNPGTNQPTTNNPIATRIPTPTPPETNSTDNSRESNSDDYNRSGYGWLQRNEIASRPQELQISGNYPPQACSPEKLDGSAVVAVKVNGDGSAVPSSIQVLNSSSKAFGDRAFSIVRGQKFPATGRDQGYMVRVRFEYDNQVCASSGERQTPEETPERNSTEAPKETPSPTSTETPDQNSTETPNPTSTDD